MTNTTKIAKIIECLKDIDNALLDTDSEDTTFCYFSEVAEDILADKYFALFTSFEYDGTPIEFTVSVFDTEDECREYVNATGKFSVLNPDELTEEERKIFYNRKEITFDEFVKLVPTSWNNLYSYTPDIYNNMVDFSPINEG